MCGSISRERFEKVCNQATGVGGSRAGISPLPVSGLSLVLDGLIAEDALYLRFKLGNSIAMSKFLNLCKDFAL